MTLIKPISDLRNKANEISELAHRERQPIFITKNGEGELVVMSQALYEQMQAKLELYQKLAEAEILYRKGEKGRSHSAVIKSLKSRLRKVSN